MNLKKYQGQQIRYSREVKEIMGTLEDFTFMNECTGKSSYQPLLEKGIIYFSFYKKSNPEKILEFKANLSTKMIEVSGEMDTRYEWGKVDGFLNGRPASQALRMKLYNILSMHDSIKYFFTSTIIVEGENIKLSFKLR